MISLTSDLLMSAKKKKKKGFGSVAGITVAQVFLPVARSGVQGGVQVKLCEST